MTEDEDVIEARVDWRVVEALPATYANQFFAQLGLPAGNGEPDGIYVGLGTITPPVLLGSENERRARAEKFAESGEMVPVLKLYLSRQRAEELVQVIQTTIAQFDATVSKLKEVQQHG